MSTPMPARPTRSAPPPKRRRQRGAHILSTVLFLAAIGFAIAAGYLYVQDRDKPEPRIPPTAQPGRNDLGAVLQEFKNSGLDASYGRGTARSSQIPDVGQLLTIEGQTVLVFIYNDQDKAAATADRKAAAEQVDLDTMEITTPSNTDLRKGDPIFMAQGSNVITIVIGGDDELAAKIEKVVEALP